jgi:hypothetical protein
MQHLSRFNGGGRRRTARLAALLLPCAFVVLLIWSLSIGARAQADSLPSALRQLSPHADPPPLTVSINLSHDWVLGEYAPGHTIWVTVTNATGIIKATVEVTTMADVPDWGGVGFATWVGGPWQPEQPDLAPNDWVHVASDDGAAASAQIGEITGAVDADADSVTGAVDVPWLLPGPLDIFCRGWGAPAGAPEKQDSVTPDGLDPYTCAWSPNTEWDVEPGQDLAVLYHAPAGHEIIAVFQNGDFYVDSAAGQDTDACGAQATPCRTISHTLANRAADGATIFVASGVYTENVVIPFSVALMGGFDPVTWNRNLSVYETVVNGATVNGATVNTRQTEHHPVVEVVNDQAEVTLDGLTLTGGGGELAGGVLANNSTVTIRNCYIHHNSADGNQESWSGAGVLAFSGRGLVIENSRIVNNTMGMNPGGASGIRIHSTPLTLVNSVVADNRGEMAVHANAPVTITHSTIANSDGGVLVNPPETALLNVINSIIHGTEWAIGLGDQGSADVRYTLVEGSYDGEGNLDADPQFVDAANGDYELQANSPAVNAGTANYPNPLIFDLEGRTRDWQPDMGAYELPLVNHDASARGVVLPAAIAVGQAVTPAAAVLNAGAATLDNPTPVRCTVALDATPFYTQTVATSAPWAPFVWQSLEFPPFTPAVAGLYTVTCVTQLAGDERPENDSHVQTVAVVNDAADGWSKDNLADSGVIPSALDDWYQSPDIWVRHADDGGVVHQDPIANVTNYVYARLRNRGTETFTGTVEMSWIAPSLGARCGDWAPIGAIPFTNLLPGEIRIVKTAWTPTQSGHTCLQALQDSADDPYDRALECTPLWVPWDNNLTWRNVNIFDNQPVQGSSVTNQAATLDIINPYNTAQSVDVLVDKQHWPTGGEVLLTLPGDLFARWQAAGALGENIEVLTATQQVRLTAGVQSVLRGLPLNAAESATLDAAFTGPAGADFMLAFTAQIHGATIGGVSYRWVVDATPPVVQSASPAPDSTAVAVDASIVLTFSKAMDPGSLTLDANPPLTGWQASWNAAKTVATVTHDALRGGESYMMTALAFDANSIALAAPYTWSFHTAARIYLPTVTR